MKKKTLKFKCPRCGSEDLCFHVVETHKTPVVFENGKFESAGHKVEIDIDEKLPVIRCGNGHPLELMSDEGYVSDCDDMQYWLEEREQINQNG